MLFVSFYVVMSDVFVKVKVSKHEVNKQYLKSTKVQCGRLHRRGPAPSVNTKGSFQGNKNISQLYTNENILMNAIFHFC